MNDDRIVEVSRPVAGVVQLTLNRPGRLNAMTSQLVADLHASLDDVAADPEARVVILTGAGRGFCAGLDLGGYGLPPRSEHLGPTQRGFATQRHIASLIPVSYTHLTLPTICSV